ncbi:hypothetical protein [Dyadobacter luticola]|uniref:Uncharacterized protein n=1 Tax=Dyadobacter luticola TaxID=1979387 RepID=A0A5R9KTM9_9BACT|nr:hypothetical protein [Dyadobacter luticola]TLU99479.1 hypothetical protein FEN17_23260 [Dyadobacter luticola]
MTYPLSFVIAAMLLVARLPALAQSESEKLDLPGDNLNLYAVMKLFQESKTLEGLEKALNSGGCEINNLDLDGDKRVDYIRVADNFNNNIHTITLDVPLNDYEEQDVAVFFVEKRTNGQILIQLMGDEDLYGRDYFLEPTDQTFRETPHAGYGPEKVAAAAKFTGPNEVASWPIIKYIFAPGYVTWSSPMRWGNYPAYWKPQPPQYWHFYYAYHYHWRSYYNKHYRRWAHFRNPAWFSQFYGGNFRSRSVTVKTRVARGDYKSSYSKPASAAEGSALFAKKFPTLPASHESPPSFDSSGKPRAPKAAPAAATESRPEKKSAAPTKSSAKKKRSTASKSSKSKSKRKSTPTKKSARGEGKS